MKNGLRAKAQCKASDRELMSHKQLKLRFGKKMADRNAWDRMKK